ncbi:hypothetical protein Mal15_52420 [Stieleria maiorica]|uniref:Uncharacterized protein n=1 Tax=Stieleria maiorica TaxID=2795974 RepID=A0A5B9MNK3_9BACT|nr:hypothetical protein Mal15_52420 [Stieleria maiorica]
MTAVPGGRDKLYDGPSGRSRQAVRRPFRAVATSVRLVLGLRPGTDACKGSAGAAQNRGASHRMISAESNVRSTIDKQTAAKQRNSTNISQYAHLV